MSFLKTRYTAAAVFFALGIVAAATAPEVLAQAPSEPGWPLDLPTRYLTSNFMEFRGGRFHAGIDLKTNSETGYTVRAVEDGYISRVRNRPSCIAGHRNIARTGYGSIIEAVGIPCI